MFLVLILSTQLKISKHIKQYAIREAARNSQNNPNLPKNCICIMTKPILQHHVINYQQKKFNSARSSDKLKKIQPHQVLVNSFSIEWCSRKF